MRIRPRQSVCLTTVRDKPLRHNRIERLWPAAPVYQLILILGHIDVNGIVRGSCAAQVQDVTSFCGFTR